MKKTDIGKGKRYAQGGQEWKQQRVKTPFGELTVPGFVRVPSMKASARTWKIWHERFVERPKTLEKEDAAKRRADLALQVLKKWKDKKRGKTNKLENIFFRIRWNRNENSNGANG